MGWRPLADWSTGLMMLGGVVLAFSLAFSGAQFLVASVSERNFGFLEAAPAAVGLGLALMFAGAALRFLAEPREPPTRRV